MPRTDDLDDDRIRVVGITSVSGGGKTAVTRRLAEALGDAVAVHFDDYDDTNVHPANVQRWFLDGADYDAYKTPVFTRHLEALKAGDSIRYPVVGGIVGPARYVVADAPLGRAHAASGRLIDLLVFIDTPLDVAMARRIARDIDRAIGWPMERSLDHVKAQLAGYEARARPVYEHFQARMRADSDLVLDGTPDLDLIVERIRGEVEARWPSRPTGARRRPGRTPGC